jgi:deoxyribodipyrimidine photo-lyase
VNDRVRALNGRPFRDGAQYVLYWAQMNRRTQYNHGLACAIKLANEHRLPVLYYEAGYPAFIAREHNARVPEKLEAPYYAVDSSCVVPMNRIEKREYAACTIRPKIKKLLPFRQQ